jgi:hypothetical protein
MHNTNRAEITKKLIEEKGFSFVAVEGDWPDVYRINRSAFDSHFVVCDASSCTQPGGCRYVQLAQSEHEDANVVEALGDFQRFPTWFVFRTFNTP